MVIAICIAGLFSSFAIISAQTPAGNTTTKAVTKFECKAIP